jgi:hypothetical protein
MLLLRSTTMTGNEMRMLLLISMETVHIINWLGCVQYNLHCLEIKLRMKLISIYLDYEIEMSYFMIFFFLIFFLANTVLNRKTKANYTKILGMIG